MVGKDLTSILVQFIKGKDFEVITFIANNTTSKLSIRILLEEKESKETEEGMRFSNPRGADDERFASFAIIDLSQLGEQTRITLSMEDAERRIVPRVFNRKQLVQFHGRKGKHGEVVDGFREKWCDKVREWRK